MENIGKAPKISIVIASYNGEKTIKRTIESVLAQTFANFEIIVVDDHSSDGTVEIVKEIQRKDERINLFVLEKNSGGPATPRTFGAKKAAGEYVAFLDQDDIYLKNNLEIKNRFLDENPKVEIVGGKSLVVDLDKKKFIDYNAYLPLNWLLRKSAVEKNGFFNSNQNGVDEIGLMFRVIKNERSNESMAFLPTPYTVYGRHKEQNSYVEKIDNQTFIKRLESLLSDTKNTIFDGHNSVLYSRIGNFYCRLGQMKEGRKNFINSVKLKFNLFSVILWILSFFGKWFYLVVEKFLRFLQRKIIWKLRYFYARFRFKDQYKEALSILKQL